MLKKSKKKLAAVVSILSNSSLILMKIVVGLLSGSVSIISEAIHSGIDLLASCIAYISVKTSDAPADDEHPYGHEKIENVSGVIEAALIFVAVFLIIYGAIKKIIYPTEVEQLGLASLVMFVSAGLNLVVSKYIYKVARAEKSIALEANAFHLKADVITSVGVGVGVGTIWIGELLGYNLHFLDPLLAMLVAFIIGKEAFSILITSFNPLLDYKASNTEIAIIRESITENLPPLASFSALRTRSAGKTCYLDFIIHLPNEMSIEHSHSICDNIESSIKKQLPHSSTVIHVEPLKKL